MAYSKKTWVDDDGSLTVGTLFSAANMNNIEAGISGLIELLEKAGMGVVVHGSTKTTARPTGFDIVVWIGTVEPEHGAENDLWINPEDFGVNSTAFVPACQVYKAAGQSIPTGTFAELLFDSERYDNAAMHSTSSNTGRLVAPKTGIYLASLHVGLPTSVASGIQEIIMAKNGGNWSGQRMAVEPNGEEQFVYTETIFLEAGQYVSFLMFNTAAGAKVTAGLGGAGAPQEASLTWLGTGTPSLTPVDWGIVTELPAGANVGDTCTYKNGSILWRLQKVDTTETPWAKLGGAPLLNEVVTQETTKSKTFTGLTTAGPSLTLPLKGEYDIETACQVFGEGGNSLMSYKIGATAASEADQIQLGNGGTTVMMGSRRKRKSGFAAGVVLLAQYANESGLGASFGYRRMLADPIKVG